MPRGDGPHPPLSWAAPALVLLILAVAGVASWVELGDRLGLAAPDPLEEPALVEPPGGIDLPPPSPARPVAQEVPGTPLDPTAVRSAVAGLVDARRLGPRFALQVTDVDGAVAYRTGPARVVPASTTKLLTAAAALEVLGGDHRFETVVRRQGRTLVLVGGGDPLLQRAPDPDVGYPEERADLRTLARRVASAVGGARAPRLRLQYDESLFSGPSASPSWPDDYVRDDVVSPISALWADQGRDSDGSGARVRDPARSAARVFGAHLQDLGVRVGPPTPAPRAEGTVVGRVRSAPLVQVVQEVLETSDNEAAEVLLRHVALQRGLPGSFAGGVRAATDVLAQLGVRMDGVRWYDGSGLSRRNRLPVRTLVEVMVTALAQPQLSRVVEGLPVAGFTGSLSDRFVLRSVPGLGRVRAKTGTLTGVSGLAGVVTGRDDAVMVYVALADRLRETDTLWARARLDRISAALAGCRCRARP